MKLLLINPVIGTDQLPVHIPVRPARLAKIAEMLGHQVGLGDLNLHRETANVESYRAELKRAEWDAFYIHCDHAQYRGMKGILGVIRKMHAQKPVITGGSLVKDAAENVLIQNPEITVAIRDGLEIAFKDVLWACTNGRRWDEIPNILYSDPHLERGFAATQSLKTILREESNAAPPPGYSLIDLDNYFRFSGIPFCPESAASKHRLGFAWDIDGFLPDPEIAVDQVYAAGFRYRVDFANMLDESFMADPRWVEKFCDEYIERDINAVIPWGCIGNSETMANDPSIIRPLIDASCRYIELKICTRPDEPATYSLDQRVIDEVASKSGMIVLRCKTDIGLPCEGIDGILEKLQFCIKNKLDVEPVIARPDMQAVDSGDFEPTALSLSDPTSPMYASRVFDFGDLLALRSLFATKDMKSILQLSHLKHWTHGEKWKKWCPNCV